MPGATSSLPHRDGTPFPGNADIAPLAVKLLAGCLGLLALPGGAYAQSVDYAGLEQMFGEPVTTSVTGKPQRASEAPAALIIITRDDIRRSAASDVPGLVSAYAGIDLARWTQGQADVAVRGGVQPYNPSLLVLVNGRQVYLDHYGMTNWAGIGVQLDEIQQIEVVKGPNSALFGFNAVSGVINIITVNPLQSEQAKVTAGIGNAGQRFASAVATLKVAEGLGLRVSGGYEIAHQLKGLETSPIAPVLSPTRFDPRHSEVAAELYGKLDDRTDLSVSVTHSDNRQLEMPMLPVTIPAYYRFTSAGARLSHDTGWGVLSARFLRNWSDFHGEAIKNVEFSNRVMLASVDGLVRAGRNNTLRLGLEYRSNSIITNVGYPGATRYDVFAASGMWESQIGDKLTFTTAARIDTLKLRQDGEVNQPTIFTKADFDRSITDWSVSGALLFKLDDNNSIRANASRGIETPSLSSIATRYDYTLPGLPTVVISGNPHLKPATVWSAELGFTHMTETGGRLELTAFYNRTSDLIAQAGTQTMPRTMPPASPNIVFTTDNVGSYRSYGLEASLSGHFTPSWHWMLNYTWDHVDQDVPENNGGTISRPFTFDTSTPAHKVKAQVSYEQGAWLATATARYTSSTRQLFVAPPILTGPLELVRIDETLALDAKVSFKASDRLTFTLSGENLTGASGAYLSPAPAERRVRASVSVGF